MQYSRRVVQHRDGTNFRLMIELTCWVHVNDESSFEKGVVDYEEKTKDDP